MFHSSRTRQGVRDIVGFLIFQFICSGSALRSHEYVRFIFIFRLYQTDRDDGVMEISRSGTYLDDREMSECWDHQQLFIVQI